MRQRIQRKGDRKKDQKRERERWRAKGRKNTTVKRKNSVFLVIVLGHVQGHLLHVCACNSFLLTLYTNIFILDSDQFFLPLSTNLLFGLLGPESVPVLGSSQSWSLHFLFWSNRELLSIDWLSTKRIKRQEQIIIWNPCFHCFVILSIECGQNLSRRPCFLSVLLAPVPVYFTI